MSRRSTERSDDFVVGEARWHMPGAVLAAMVLTILLPDDAVDRRTHPRRRGDEFGD